MLLVAPRSRQAALLYFKYVLVPSSSEMEDDLSKAGLAKMRAPQQALITELV